jgi:hypothetical protein
MLSRLISQSLGLYGHFNATGCLRFYPNSNFDSIYGSRDSVVGIATGCGLDYRGVKNFLFSMSSRPTLGFTQPPIKLFPEDFSQEARRSGREADRSPPASAEVQKMWIYTSTFP